MLIGKGVFNINKKKTRIDLTGKTFERLTVIKYAYTKNKRAYWECICSCGNPNIFIAMGKTLKNGGTKSCGCLRVEASLKPKYRNFINNYIYKNDYIIIEVVNNKNNKTYKSTIDCIDYDLVKNYSWSIIKSGYLISYDSQNNIVFLHKLILYGDNYDTKLEGDHIDGNKLNNKRNNLRKVTHQLNSYNNKQYSNNTSGMTGVWLNKKDNKWCAEINYEKRKYRLGYYINKEDAIFIREIAELKLHGEYSRRYLELKEKYKDIDLNSFNFQGR